MLKLWREARERREQDEHPLTILFVTHSVAESCYLSERVLVLTPRPGRIFAEATLPSGPRDRLSPEFAQQQKRISAMLQEAS